MSSPAATIPASAALVVVTELLALLLVLVIGASLLAQSSTWQASRAAPVLTSVLHDLAPLLPEPVSRFVSRSMTPSDADSPE